MDHVNTRGAGATPANAAGSAPSGEQNLEHLEALRVRFEQAAPQFRISIERSKLIPEKYQYQHAQEMWEFWQRAALANQPAPTAAPEQVAQGADERTLFEAHCKRKQLSTEPATAIGLDHLYADQYTRDAWDAWQAARAISQPSEAAPLAWRYRTKGGKHWQATTDPAVAATMQGHANIEVRPLIDAAPSLPAAAPAAGDELYIGVANNDQGVHITVMQTHADGSATAIHAAKAPAGDSISRINLAASPVVRTQSEESAGVQPYHTTPEQLIRRAVTELQVLVPENLTGAQQAHAGADEDGERWRFMMVVADDPESAQAKAMEQFGRDGESDDTRPESVQMVEIVDKARAAIRAAQEGGEHG